jgi:pilus assembly protein FimV
MSPAAPRKPAADELIELTDVAEDESPDNPGGGLDPTNVDASFEQELEELFSEDVGQAKPAKASALADEDDALLLEDVAESAPAKPAAAEPAEAELDLSGFELPPEEPKAAQPEGELDFSGLDAAIDDMTGAKPAPQPAAPEGELDLDALLDDTAAKPAPAPAPAQEEDEFGALSLDDLVAEGGAKKEEPEEVVGLDELLAAAEGEAQAAPAAPARPAAPAAAAAKPAAPAAPPPPPAESVEDLLAAAEIDVSDIVAAGQHPEVSGAPPSDLDVRYMLDEVEAAPAASAEAVQAVEGKLSDLEAKLAALDQRLAGLDQRLAGIEPGLRAEISKAVPAEAARIIREEIEALSKELAKG